MKQGIIITGVCGFVGSNLAKRLLRETNYFVYGVDNLSCGFMENINDILIHPNFMMCNRDIRNLTNTKIVEEDCAGIDVYDKIDWKYIFHFAARGEVYWCKDNPGEAVDINIGGTVTMLELAKNLKIDHFYFADTSAEYDSLTESMYFPSSELMAPNVFTPMGFYPITKMAASQFVRSYGKKNNFGTTLFRYTNVYGPSMNLERDIPPVVGSFTNHMLFKNEQAVIYGDGEKRRDFLHIDDLTDFHMQVLKIRGKEKGTETYNAGSGKNWSIKEIHRLVYNACSDIDHTVPHDIDFRPNQLDEAQITLADISKAKKELGWKPIISIEKGIEDTVEQLYTKYLQRSK
jgi:nucleoside-diphosphate-sugar epimerase